MLQVDTAGKGGKEIFCFRRKKTKKTPVNLITGCKEMAYHCSCVAKTSPYGREEN